MYMGENLGMNENTPEKIVEKLRQTINKGKYGKDYTIISRDDIIHIFSKEVPLIKRYSVKIEPQIVKLYIKFTWTKSAEFGNLFFISFHKWDEK